MPIKVREVTRKKEVTLVAFSLREVALEASVYILDPLVVSVPAGPSIDADVLVARERLADFTRRLAEAANA